MTDKIIINTISKIHFTLISFFIFVIFTLSVGFLVLQEGVSFQKLDLAKIKIEQLYIKWDEKLSISAQKITIKPKKGNTKKLDFQALNDTLGTFAFFMEWVEKITFGNIQYGDSTLTIDYKEKEEEPSPPLLRVLIFMPRLLCTTIPLRSPLKSLTTDMPSFLERYIANKPFMIFTPISPCK